MNRRYFYILFLTALFVLISSCGNSFTENGVFESSGDIVRQAKMDIVEITYDELKQKLENKEIRVLVDVREPFDFEEGYINMPDEETDEFPYPETFTVNIPRGLLEFEYMSKDYWDNDLFVEMPSKDEEVIVYCHSGSRSALAVKTLNDLGYTNVVSYKGGYRKWLDPTLPDIVEEAAEAGG